MLLNFVSSEPEKIFRCPTLVAFAIDRQTETSSAHAILICIVIIGWTAAIRFALSSPRCPRQTHLNNENRMNAHLPLSLFSFLLFFMLNIEWHPISIFMIDEKQHRCRCARLVIGRTSDRNNSTFAQCLAGQGISARNEKRRRMMRRCYSRLWYIFSLPPAPLLLSSLSSSSPPPFPFSPLSIMTPILSQQKTCTPMRRRATTEIVPFYRWGEN